MLLNSLQLLRARKLSQDGVLLEKEQKRKNGVKTPVNYGQLSLKGMSGHG